MKGPQFKVRLNVDGGPELSRRTRTVLIGNCGRLFGGVVLMPEARVDDGLLDTIILSPKGVVGWTAVAARVLSRRRHGHSIVDHYTGTRVSLRADRPEEVQVDGDIMGAARSVSAWVEPRGPRRPNAGSLNPGQACPRVGSEQAAPRTRSGQDS